MEKKIVKDILFLSQVSQQASQEDLYLARDLQDTLLANRATCVGLAANMIGVQRRVIIFNLGLVPMVMFNPVLLSSEGPYETEEGCLSLTGVRPTRRYETIRVAYRDTKWQEQTITLTGFPARFVNMSWITWRTNHLGGKQMKRIVFELIFIATTWYIFLPPLNLTSWEFLFFLCGHLLLVAILFGFGKGINLVKTVHVRHGKAEAALNLEGFKINRLGKILLASIGGILLLAALVSLVTSSIFQAKNYANVVTVTEKDFTEFPKTDTSKVPILDRSNC